MSARETYACEEERVSVASRIINTLAEYIVSPLTRKIWNRVALDYPYFLASAVNMHISQLNVACNNLKGSFKFRYSAAFENDKGLHFVP
jgi:hypothetical protein